MSFFFRSGRSPFAFSQQLPSGDILPTPRKTSSPLDVCVLSLPPLFPARNRRAPSVRVLPPWSLGPSYASPSGALVLLYGASPSQGTYRFTSCPCCSRTLKRFPSSLFLPNRPLGNSSLTVRIVFFFSGSLISTPPASVFYSLSSLSCSVNCPRCLVVGVTFSLMFLSYRTHFSIVSLVPIDPSPVSFVALQSFQPSISLAEPLSPQFFFPHTLSNAVSVPLLFSSGPDPFFTPLLLFFPPGSFIERPSPVSLAVKPFGL